NRVRYATAEHLLQRQHGHPLVHTAPVGDRHPTVLMVDRAGVLPGARNGQVVAGPRILLVQGRPVSPGHLLQHSAIAVVVDATFDPQVEARRPRCTPKETAWPYPSRVIHPRMRPRRSISVTRRSPAFPGEPASSWATKSRPRSGSKANDCWMVSDDNGAPVYRVRASVRRSKNRGRADAGSAPAPRTLAARPPSAPRRRAFRRSHNFVFISLSRSCVCPSAATSASRYGHGRGGGEVRSDER